jgi:hypothetical protein
MAMDPIAPGIRGKIVRTASSGMKGVPKKYDKRKEIATANVPAKRLILNFLTKRANSNLVLY